MKRENNFSIYVIVGVLILILICFLVPLSACGGENEKFTTVLGQLGPYQKQLNECLNECDRLDPSNRLLSQGDFNCGMYCESVVTEMARRGIPPETFPINNNMTKCQKQCDTPNTTPNQKRKCLSMCHGQNEIADWCKTLWCPYSLYDEDECMRQCVSLWTTNNNQVSWTWKSGL